MTKGHPDWERFERHVQDVLELRSTPGSGNQWHDVGDGVSVPEDPYKVIVDCKFTEGKGYRLDGLTLYKWWEKAGELGYHFALPVRLEGSDTLIREWVTLPLDDYAELVDAVRILNGPKRCGARPPVNDNDRSIFQPMSFSCCRRKYHLDSHDNGEIEWDED